jgi:hypothetical protein
MLKLRAILTSAANERPKIMKRQKDEVIMKLPLQMSSLLCINSLYLSVFGQKKVAALKAKQTRVTNLYVPIY